MVCQYLNFMLLLGKLPYRWSISPSTWRRKAWNRRNAENHWSRSWAVSVSLRVFSSFLGISWDIWSYDLLMILLWCSYDVLMIFLCCSRIIYNHHQKCTSKGLVHPLRLRRTSQVQRPFVASRQRAEWGRLGRGKQSPHVLTHVLSDA